MNGVIVVDNFLKEDECNKILEGIDKDLWLNSKIVREDPEHGYYETHSTARTNRIYYANFFSSGIKKRISVIENKLHKRFKISEKNFEAWQLSAFKRGEHFGFHLDCGCWEGDLSGEREKTILIYISTPEMGGETYFRALNLYITPLRGRLVIWNNLLPDGNCNHAMIHAGLPVRSGTKITLNTWIRQKNIVTTN